MHPSSAAVGDSPRAEPLGAGAYVWCKRSKVVCVAGEQACIRCVFEWTLMKTMQGVHAVLVEHGGTPWPLWPTLGTTRSVSTGHYHDDLADSDREQTHAGRERLRNNGGTPTPHRSCMESSKPSSRAAGCPPRSRGECFGGRAPPKMALMISICPKKHSPRRRCLSEPSTLGARSSLCEMRRFPAY